MAIQQREKAGRMRLDDGAQLMDEAGRKHRHGRRPPSPAEGVLRIMEYNVAGLLSRELQLVEHARQCRAHVLILSETFTSDHYALVQLARRYGWRILLQARLKGNGDAAKHGGVAVILTEPQHFALHLHSTDPRGLIVAEVRARSGAFKPVLVVGAYLSPQGSPYAKWRADLLKKVEDTVLAAQPPNRYGGQRVIVAGDFNSRVRALNGVPRHLNYNFNDVGADTDDFREVLQRLRMAPVLGRTAEHPARVNSRQISSNVAPAPGEGAEVCFLCVGVGATPRPINRSAAELWAANSGDSEFHSHIPQAAELDLEPVSDGVPEPEAGGAPRRWRKLVYGDERWSKVADAVSARLATVGAQIRDPATSMERASELFINAYHAALDEAIPAHGAGPRARRGGHGGGAQREAVERRNGVDVASHQTLPPAVLSAILLARRTGTAEDKLAARRALNKFKRERRRGDARAMNSLRRRDPKAFFAVMRGFAPEDISKHEPQAPIPWEDGKEPPTERFSNAFKARLGGGNAQAPPAVEDQEWLEWVRRAPLQARAELGRPISPMEVFRAIWYMGEGAHTLQDVECPASGDLCAACPVCRPVHEAARRWEGRNDLRRSPPCPPHLQPQSVINGELQSVYLTWPRHKDPEETATHRRAVAAQLATILNKYLDAGSVPAATAAILSVPILKAGKDNKADPDSYRFTSMTTLLLKVLDVVITARVTHHAARVGAVAPQHQGAFTAAMGTEWHAWAVREAVLDAWHRRRNVFAVFVDLEKAYDNVHPEALLATLERQGVPANVRDLIRGWFAQRTMAMRVNGETSGAVPITGGVGQGNVSSPIFWNIFFNSLNLYLEGVAPHLGVTVGAGPDSTLIVSLAFADDVGGLTDTPEKAQELLRLVEKWCAAWGMKMNVGIKKTAVLPLIHPADRARPQFQDAGLPIITLADGTVVPYCSEYKYLGYGLNRDMSRDHTGKLLQAMHYNFNRWFRSNSLVRHTAPATRVQLVKTAMLGSYLLCLVPWKESDMKRIRPCLAAYAREMAKLPPGLPSQLSHIMSGLPTVEYLLAKERTRMLLSLAGTQHKAAPAARVYGALMAAGRPRGSWVADTTEGLRTLRADGMRDIKELLGLRNAGLAAGDIPAAAATTGREAARLAQLRKDLAEGVSGNHTLLSTPYPDGTPLVCVGAVTLGGAYAEQWEYGRVRALPLSACGTGGRGLLPMVTTALMPGVDEAVATSWLGPRALSISPLGPGAPGWRLPQNASPQQYRDSAHGQQCPLCRGGTASPHHILVECTGSSEELDMVAERAMLRGVAQRLITMLGNLIYVAHGHDAMQDGLLPVHNIDWGTATNKNMLMRIFIVAPWPAAAVDDANAVVARTLGRLFDGLLVQNDRMRPIANAWVGWAGSCLLRICKKWSAEVDRLAGHTGGSGRVPKPRKGGQGRKGARKSAPRPLVRRVSLGGSARI